MTTARMSIKTSMGKKTENFVYNSLRVLSVLRLIPFYIVSDKDRPGARETPNFAGEGSQMVDNRKLIRFEKSSADTWLYYIMTTFYFGMNGAKILVFLSPMLGNGIKMDIHFGGDMFFFSAMFFSGIFKFTILFCVHDLLFLLNEVDQSIIRMQQFSSTQGKVWKTGDDADQGTADENGGIVVRPWEKYCWYCQTEGILGVWWTAFTGHAAWFVLIVMGIYKSWERQLGMEWMVLECSLVTFLGFLDCFISITSVYLTVAIIVQLKLNLTLFEELAYIQKRKSQTGSSLSQLIQRFTSLVVFCAYGNGYYRVLFPGYIGVVQFIVLALLYVALTGHAYLPMFIYWTYPAASVFVFCVLLLLVLSQVGNIFRQSETVSQRLRRKLALEFQSPSSSSSQVDKVTSSSNQISNAADVKIWSAVSNLQGPSPAVSVLQTSAVEKRCLQKRMLTIRPFGFYSGFYGAIDQNTPASMTSNICNCMILLLSFG